MIDDDTAEFKDLLAGRMRPASGLYFMSLRLRKEMTQAQLAQALQVNQMRICRIEQGRYILSEEDRIAYGAFFDVDPESFLSTPNMLAGLGS